MKTWILPILSLICALGLLVAAEAQEQPATGQAPTAPGATESISQPEEQTPPMEEETATDTNEAVAPAEQPSPEAPPPAPPATATYPKADQLRLNFRGAPIELVLNYLSDAAGFIIQLNTPVKGKVDVWSNQPVTRNEAVELLNSVLNKNGYAAVRNGRVLTIMSKEDALHGDIPVKVSTEPSSIPKNDEIVTEIIPIRFVEAEQLVKDLSPMISPHATIVANEAGNSIVITDTQANIRHLAEIISAIDSSAEDVTEVRVFHLKHHDPTEIANLLSSLFSDQGNTSGNQVPIRFGGFGGFGAFRGGFRGGNFGRGGNAQGNTAANGQEERIKKRQQVVAVADPRTSSVVVTAAKDLMDQIAGMVAQLDQEFPEKVQHVSVFHLDNADPQQVQQVLQDMFQSSTSQRSSSSTQLSPLQERIQQNTGSMSTSTRPGGSTGLGSTRNGSGLPSF